ncbi:uncharacterized protein [Spinacia oleracea]|uniref:Uncharacterized protein isoform X1 n=1 Tax=Spinacia oleracea TaxID=3562 RepID=A0ABM3RM33_SPIOL|nr:uncharacterized protein LOC130470482 isoform X1 [Spinacia oleracea]XP_056696668.1 uncharacterized protein LOC130470482 isoform X1 [Spinacia oleracea]XP_056696669.1 uncharacterized protein LOC130470482 isoform X1 [Spinacia oleracea]
MFATDVALFLPSSRKVASDAAPSSKRRAGGTGKPVFKSTASKTSKVSSAHQTASASPCSQKAEAAVDPLAGIPEAVRRNIPLRTAERARSSGEIPDPQKAIDAELDQIASSGGFTSKDRRRIMGLMRNAIPPKYAETLPEAAENQLAAMQSSALDMFILLDSLKKWLTALVHEEARHRLLASQCGDQHFAELEELRLNRQGEIDVVTKSLSSQLAENKHRLEQIDQNFSQIEDLSGKIKEKETEFSRLETRFEELEAQLEAARKEVATSKGVLNQSAVLGEKSIRGGMELAWNAEFGSQRPFSWFEKFLNYQVEVEKAQKEGRAPPEFVSSDDDE